ncbi:DJ-1/PfpI family protein [Pandoraea sputorum]|uniref:DJ-1/PfpI family protein n=1 Tax=Pandoraea sputorum TaxID=93222 RepID=UPI001E2EB8A1|nr:DJ-1/PfpI family protein [Pandoraea sputorum]MCE4062287.1 DJ-1/PfpI family protein [Pandoraea sputorum]
MRYARFLLTALVCLSFVTAGTAADSPDAEVVSRARQDLLAALAGRPQAPVVAVIALNEGTETTDFLVPYAVLKRAGIGQVEAVAVEAGDVTLMPALRIVPDTTLAAFDARHPRGADVVIVPAMHVDNDPRVLQWLQRQAANGALIVGICSGAKVLSQAGLLRAKRFTGHWYDRDDLRKANPTARYVPNLRYLYDDGIVTTTGVSASLPLSLALVEGIAGEKRAADAAHALGVADWSAPHASDGFRLDASRLWTIASQWLAFWRHETLAIPVSDGVDDVSLALVSDAWSRTWRSEAIATHEGTRTVRMASGLRLVPQPDLPVTPVRTIALASHAPAMTNFKAALDAIEQRYGSSTRDLVALSLEYPDGLR